MTLVDYRIDASGYANIYSALEIDGTTYLGFRDMPHTIAKYVQGKKTLDYGCGSGKSSMFLKALGLDVSSVDVNPGMIKAAKDNDPAGVYEVIESANIPAENETYDFVFASWVFMEVSSKEMLQRIAREIHRVLKKGGVFITLVTSKDAYNHDWESLNTEFPENEHLSTGSVVKIHFKPINLTIFDYFWSDEDYKDIFAGANLKLLESYHPYGKDTDPYDWKLEKTLSPYTAYVTRKE